MTENEALNTLHILLAHKKAIDAGEIISPNNLHSQEKEALQFILEEIQQYRAIGTVEEFKVLKKKNNPKKINSFSGCIHNNIEQDWDFAK